jgi:RHS repeat-associated protein
MMQAIRCDGHGNMIVCLFKNGSSYSINDQRSYDAWGQIRAGSTSGDPKARYVANLGHLADDESGLTYMRARYYEPSSGRFVSEDPARDGVNLFRYANNRPTIRADYSGLSDESDFMNLLGEVFKWAGLMMMWASASLATQFFSGWYFGDGNCC